MVRPFKPIKTFSFKSKKKKRDSEEEKEEVASSDAPDDVSVSQATFAASTKFHVLMTTGVSQLTLINRCAAASVTISRNVVIITLLQL